MDEHPLHNSDGHSLVPPTGVISILTRIVVATLDASGHEQAALILRRWPELVGEQIGKPFLRGDKPALEAALNESPKEAATLLGLLVEGATGENLDDADERKFILGTYALVLNIICAAMRNAKTSLALSGFVHDSNCISYWHLGAFGDPTFASNPDSLYPRDLTVYLFPEQPTKERLEKYNQEVRNARGGRQLDPSKFDGKKLGGTIAVVKRVAEQDVICENLLPDVQPVVQFRGPDESHKILLGAPALVGLYQSMLDAMKTQRVPVIELRRTFDTISTMIGKAS